MADVLQASSLNGFPPHTPPLAQVQEDPITQLARRITVDYVAFRLREKNAHAKLRGLPKDFLIPPAKVSKLFDTVRKMCYQMEDNNQVFFNSLSRKLKLDRFNAKRVYFEVMSSVFAAGINWGRVLTLFSFTAVYAQFFLESNNLDAIPELIEWASLCVDNLLKDWIQEKGGWDQLTVHFSTDDSRKGWRDAIAFGSLFAFVSLALTWK